jgi:hypothetical protein
MQSLDTFHKLMSYALVVLLPAMMQHEMGLSHHRICACISQENNYFLFCFAILTKIYINTYVVYCCPQICARQINGSTRFPFF